MSRRGSVSAFAHDRNGTVGIVTHKTGQATPICFAQDMITKTYSLDSSMYNGDKAGTVLRVQCING